ncbi:MAG: hypothetical protein AB7U63_17535, partial [Porticoccaceae bacterium]
LFGPEVKGVLDKIESERKRVAAGEESELMDLLISRKWLDMFGPFSKHPRDVVSAEPVRIVDPAQLSGANPVQIMDMGDKS